MNEVFIHIGMPKTGTTFFQKEVFNKFKNLIFINKQISSKILSSKTDKILISNESLLGNPFCGDYLKDDKIGLKKLSKLIPNAKIIISFRKHEDMVLSLYKQYLHEGGTQDINSFFNSSSSNTILNIRDLLFYKRLELIEKEFNEKPFVYLYEEINNNLEQLITDLSFYLGEETLPIKDINLKKHNVGVGYYQAKLLRLFNKIGNSNSFLNKIMSNYVTKKLKMDPRSICQNKLRFISKKPLKLNKKQKQLIKKHYEKDWDKIISFIKDQRAKDIFLDEIN